MNLYAQKAPKFGPPEGMAPPPVDTSWIHRQFCDIAYGPAEANKFNVYLPNEGDGPFPVVVFIHGGAFSGGDRTDPQVRPFLELVKCGFALVSMDHRLSGEVVFPEGLRDCAAGLGYIRDNGARWGLDTERMGFVGNSAGGNFVLMLALAQGTDVIPAEKPVLPKCVVTWFAPTDFLACIEAFREEEELFRDKGFPGELPHDHPYSPESVYLGGPILELEEAFVRSSAPTEYITPAMPPMLMQHGRMDHVVHWTQSKIFMEKANRICGEERVLLDVLPEADHADPAFETEENMARVAAFFQKHLS